MGQRSRTETVAAVMVALFRRRVWSQAELARAVGVRTETLRKLLDELTESGVPLMMAIANIVANGRPGGQLPGHGRLHRIRRILAPGYRCRWSAKTAEI